jgi:hypothetical protein
MIELLICITVVVPLCILTIPLVVLEGVGRNEKSNCSATQILRGAAIQILQFKYIICGNKKNNAQRTTHKYY